QPRRLRRVSYRALVRRRRHFLLALEFHHETQGHARAGGHGQHVADRRRPDRRRGAPVPLPGHHRPRFARAPMSPFRTSYLRDGRWVRSNPRDRRPHPPVARWVSGDVDGDGRVLSLRRQDPSGEYVEDPELPGVMLPRRLEDAGPYCQLWPEGTIENFDGTHVP